LVFDFTLSGLESSTDTIRVAPTTAWSDDSQYGYVTDASVIEEFERTRLTRSRFIDMRTGHAMPEMQFRARVEPGRWRVSLWMDAGLEDSSTVTVEMEGQTF